jgi:hypothetical protein
MLQLQMDTKERKRLTQKKYWDNNKEKIKQRRRAYELEYFKREDVIKRAKENKKKYQLKSNSTARVYHWNHREIRLQRNREYGQKWRTILFLLLGQKCIKCGFDDRRALQFDHIHGGGGKDRLRFKTSSTAIKYYAQHPDEALETIQVLCANCNWIKKHENNETNNPDYRVTPRRLKYA